MNQMYSNHCPLGCERSDLDELGYCHHLVGFTNDGKTMECLEPHLAPNGEPTGRMKVNGKKKAKVLPTDILVNPEKLQKVEGVESMAKSWVSSRVYRNVPKPEPTEEELEALTTPA